MTPPHDLSAVDLAHADTWVFDLDNTLYPAACNLFAEIDVRITAFVARTLSIPPDEARVLQKRYYRDHGTTLNGLMQEHGLSPSGFLDYVHAISLDPLHLAPDLNAGLSRLPGRKLVYTNGSVGHAERVMRKLGIDHHFHGVHDIVAAGMRPKPCAVAFDGFLDRFGVDPTRAVMFEDLARNLRPAHAQGMTTVLVTSHADATHDWHKDEPQGFRPGEVGPEDDHLHFVTDHLPSFLEGIRVASPLATGG
jgi:putative hydrolase of the HAD superfamily